MESEIKKMIRKYATKGLFGLLVLLLSAVTVIPAAAAMPTPIQMVLINDDPVGNTVTTQPGKSWVTYDDGTCVGKCRFDTHIPANAAALIDQVPYPVVSTLWAQVDGNGGYTVCFNVTSIRFPQVWQFVDGQWVLISTTVVDNMICVRGHGEGVFGLFGLQPPPSIKHNNEIQEGPR
jgi:hypothetical protein